MAASLQLMKSREHWKPLRVALRQANRAEIDRILTELETACHHQSDAETAASDVHFATNADELKFWLIDVARLMLEDKSVSTRRLALTALESAVPHLVRTNYQELSVWAELRTTISRDYTPLLDTARSEKDPHWHRMWAALVRVMNRDLCQGSSIINMFLSIVEAGFRSPELSIREQSFDCWRLLVEVFSNNKQMNLPKRMKLICIPLKSSKSKTETIALKKFDIWWYLLNELSTHLDTLADTIFEPFIYFCFGPAFKPPLCYYFDDTFREYGAPGKIYQAIKQLSAIALIYLLGPAPELTKTLLISGHSGNTRMLPFEFPKKAMIISPMLFSTKAKLLIDACIECTVLFAQMQHLEFLELNRCLWGNLMDRISREKTLPKNELLSRIKEVMNALLKLCVKQPNDVPLRELFYDTLLIIAKSDLLTVKIGYDSPDQAMINYKSIMSVILNSDLPCPGNKSEEIIKHVFDLQRYSEQKGYWEMLQKTIQYLCETNGDSVGKEFRTIRTQIYCHLARFLIVQIRDDTTGFVEHQSTVMSFLLFPLEYDQLIVIDSVRNLWDEVYEPITLKENRSCEFTNTFCEMIKAMTIAKFTFNLVVVADFFCTVLRALPPEFDTAKPPMKVFELFKDLTRKSQAYQANLDRLEKMIFSFRELLGKMSITNLLTLILPIRNAINEMASNEKGLAMEEVKRTLHVVANKLVLPSMTTELRRQPKEVQWNCKMLLSMMLQLPAELKKGWKQSDMRKCMDICDEKDAKTPTRKKVDDEFVVIESNWKFKPEGLTEHQREKMLEKRTDIPALYNDMSQSQDSFVIKPWTPSKKSEPVRHERDAIDVVSSSADTIPAVDDRAGKKAEATVLKSTTHKVTMEEDDPKATSNVAKPDKENNDGNVLYEQPSLMTDKDQAGGGSEDDGTEYSAGTQHKKGKKSKRSILEQLRIDTVEGKTLDVMNLSRTRQSEGPDSRSTRRKNIPVRKEESAKKSGVASTTKLDEKAGSVAKDATRKKPGQKNSRSSRKLLDFENLEQNEVRPMQAPLTTKANANNTSDDVIESSQTPEISLSSVAKKVSLRRSRVEESSACTGSTVTMPMEEVLSMDRDRKAEGGSMEDFGVSKEIPEIKENDIRKNGVVHDAADTQDDQSAQDKADSESNTSIISQSVPVKLPTNISAPILEPTNIGASQPILEIPSVREQAKECVNTPMSPSRRSTRSNSTDGKVATESEPSSNRMSDESKSPKKTPLLNQSTQDQPAAAQDKATPTKMKLFNTDFEVRAALQLLNSPKRNLTDAVEHNLIENRTGLGSPKVARYSPLVVLEPMKDYPAVTRGDEVPMAEECDPNDKKDDQQNAMIPPSSPKQVDRGQSNSDEALSPMKDLDEEMEPLDKSLNRSIVSSPDLVNAQERNADLINSTLNISPIAEEKSDAAKTCDGTVLAGSTERRFARSVEDDRDPGCSSKTPTQMSAMCRRTKPSPSSQGNGAVASNSASVKALRTAQNQMSAPCTTSVIGTPRSPSTSMINLGGRGAQLINLIRQSPNPNTPPQNASTPKVGQSIASVNRLMMRKKAITTSAASGTLDLNGFPVASKAQGEENQDASHYLVFSKVLPSPQASPASSILKRRHNVDDSGDDIESPINKRKRVSFHDPPVSVTKEYIRQVEECRSPSISRCLQLATSMSSADRAKYKMRRRSKSDSISELQNFTNRDDLPSTEESAAVSSSEAQCNVDTAIVVDDGDDEELTSSPESLDESQFMIHDATDNMAPLQVTSELMDVSSGSGTACVDGSSIASSKSASAQETAEKGASGGLHFTSEDAVLQHVLQHYPLDDIVERYLAVGRTLEHGKTVRILTKELSSVMSKDPKTRHLVLDELSERHSVEFLEHAIQENSSAMVCERLSITAMIDHIFRHLRNDCMPGSAASSTSSPSTMLDEKDNDSVRLVQRIIENLLKLPDIESNGQTLSMLRDQFLREQLARKTRMEVMALLEDYFKARDQSQSAG